MPNEIPWMMNWVDAAEWVRKDSNKVTEQDVKRAQTDWAKAKQVQIQIKAKKAENNNIADFLAFLLKIIKNEKIISSVYNTFFKVTDNKTNTAYLRKSMNNIVIVWFFAPFFPKELEEFNLKWYFQDLCKLDWNLLNFDEYITYIKKLSSKYHDNIPVSQNHLLELLALIIWEFGISKEALNEDGRKKIKNELMKRLKKSK
jgi:hypothetical protein